jgi:hypothetical protein
MAAANSGVAKARHKLSQLILAACARLPQERGLFDTSSIAPRVAVASTVGDGAPYPCADVFCVRLKN